MAGRRGIVVDASQAERLALEFAVKRQALLPAIRVVTVQAGRDMQRTARALAASESFPGLARSIWTKTRNHANGTEVTVEAKSPFGYIREFGAGRSGPHPFMLPALEQHVDQWEQSLLDAAARVL